MWEKEILINNLNKGHKQAKTYDTVAFETGMPRRIMRRLVEDVMNDDDLEYCIGNMQDGRGYFIFDLEEPEDQMMAFHYIKIEEARAYSRLRSLYKLKTKLRKLGYKFDADGEGDRFRSARKLKGLTIKEASERTGIGVPEISRIETDKAIATHEQRIRLSKVYGVEL